MPDLLRVSCQMIERKKHFLCINGFNFGVDSLSSFNCKSRVYKLGSSYFVTSLQWQFCYCAQIVRKLTDTFCFHKYLMRYTRYALTVFIDHLFIPFLSRDVSQCVIEKMNVNQRRLFHPSFFKLCHEIRKGQCYKEKFYMRLKQLFQYTLLQSSPWPTRRLAKTMFCKMMTVSNRR